MLVPVLPRDGEVGDVRLLGIVLGVAVGFSSAGLRSRVGGHDGGEERNRGFESQKGLRQKKEGAESSASAGCTASEGESAGGRRLNKQWGD